MRTCSMASSPARVQPFSAIRKATGSFANPAACIRSSRIMREIIEPVMAGLAVGDVIVGAAAWDAGQTDEGAAFDRSIDVHVSRIRAAIEDDPKKPRRIITVRGAGYRLRRGDASRG